MSKGLMEHENVVAFHGVLVVLDLVSAYQVRLDLDSIRFTNLLRREGRIINAQRLSNLLQALLN